MNQYLNESSIFDWKKFEYHNRNNCVVSWCEKIVTGGRAGVGRGGRGVNVMACIGLITCTHVFLIMIIIIMIYNDLLGGIK